MRRVTGTSMERTPGRKNQLAVMILQLQHTGCRDKEGGGDDEVSDHIWVPDRAKEESEGEAQTKLAWT